MKCDLDSTLELFPRRKVQGPSLFMLGKTILNPTHRAYLKNVETWTDLLTLPNEAFGLDPYAFQYDVANVLNYLEGDNFVSFLPGWTIIAYERPLSLGAASMLIGNLHPEGVRAAVREGDGRTNLETIAEKMSTDQRKWLVSMLEKILELCVGQNADHEPGVRKTMEHWSRLT